MQEWQRTCLLGVTETAETLYREVVGYQRSRSSTKAT